MNIENKKGASWIQQRKEKNISNFQSNMQYTMSIKLIPSSNAKILVNGVSTVDEKELHHGDRYYGL